MDSYKREVMLTEKEVKAIIKAWMNKMNHYSTQEIDLKIKDGKLDQVHLKGVQRK